MIIIFSDPSSRYAFKVMFLSVALFTPSGNANDHPAELIVGNDVSGANLVYSAYEEQQGEPAIWPGR